MLEFLIDLIVQAFGEVFLEVFVDRAVSEGRRSTFVASLGHFLVGVLLGGATLLVLLNHLFESVALRRFALVATPLFLGTVFAFAESRKASTVSGHPFHRFATAACLALGFGLVRYFFAR